MQIEFWIDPQLLIYLVVALMGIVGTTIALFPQFMAGRLRWIWVSLIIISILLIWWAYFILQSLIE